MISVVVGFGLSTIEWGKPTKVHGRGWPIPSQIDGLPGDTPGVLKDLSDLGMLATLANIVLVLLTGLLAWSLFVLIARIRR
ncbi:MAG: hypothetical protein AAF733_08715 [Verrucomicrobiota bacterium]